MVYGLSDRMKKTFLKSFPDFMKWEVVWNEQPLSSSIVPSSLYLTADSETVLEEVQSNGSYIIGGLVDRNRHKV